MKTDDYTEHARFRERGMAVAELINASHPILEASYEEPPGFIDITYEGINYAFGTANGDWGYDYSNDDDHSLREGGRSTLDKHAGPVEIAQWIIFVVKFLDATVNGERS